jgi:pimeloyl-ACP methyl ester carboxylesterase
LTGLTRAADPQAIPPKPFLLHINGIGGHRLCDQWLIQGLQQGGYSGEVQFYDWTGDQPGIEALQGRALHETQARKIADTLLQYRRNHPATPIYLTSHSGGCGLAVWALELLPDDFQVETVFMFAPALSPDYDLTKALRHVKTRLYAFSSPYDAVVLGAGTQFFGTIDGLKVEAAGLKGFVQPPAADAEQYKKLIPQPYQKEWLLKYGNAGSHICALRPKFAREYIAPMLLNGAQVKQTAAAPATQPTAIR